MILTAGADVHLDSSFLIRARVPGTAEASRLLSWHGERRVIGMSALAWGEFLCGPFDGAGNGAGGRLVHRFIPIDLAVATLAAELFNATGRRTRSFADCLIAAAAILDKAPLATSNRADFERLVDAGLELVA